MDRVPNANLRYQLANKNLLNKQQLAIYIQLVSKFYTGEDRLTFFMNHFLNDGICQFNRLAMFTAAACRMSAFKLSDDFREYYSLTISTNITQINYMS